MADITALLEAWNNGDQAAQEKLIPIVYEELRKIAHSYVKRDHQDNLLQTTALVHEAYIRLVKVDDVTWKNRTHFFAIAAKLMRQILVDMARTRNSQKRGSGVEKLSLDDIVTSSSIDLDSILRVDELMSALASIDPRQCEVVEMRIFGGLTNEEIAEVMNISDRTVRREWNAGRAWLISELSR